MIDRLEEASRLYGRGRQRMDAGALEEAVVLFEQSVALEPHFKTLELLGECLDRLGRVREAIVPLAAATTLNAQVRAPALLADVFLRLEQFEDARAMAELALARDPANRAARRVRTAVRDHTGDDG